MTLTRREFIKHSGIAAGALVVTSAAPLPAWAEEKGGKILTAGRWGAMNVEVKDDVIYDLAGRRIVKPTKAGIYIVNGKKMIIK